MEEILKIYTPQTYSEDKKKFGNLPEDQMSTRLAYKIMIKERTQENSCSLSLNWKSYSKTNLLLKMLMFGWKCINKKIAINVLRNCKMREVNKRCPLCKKYDETIKDALFHCEHAIGRLGFLSPLKLYPI